MTQIVPIGHNSHELLMNFTNHVQIRNVARSRSKHWLLKGTLEVTCFYQMCTLIDARVSVYFSFLQSITLAIAMCS